jgi:hypothetical protein
MICGSGIEVAVGKAVLYSSFVRLVGKPFLRCSAAFVMAEFTAFGTLGHRKRR